MLAFGVLSLSSLLLQATIMTMAVATERNDLITLSLIVLCWLLKRIKLIRLCTPCFYNGDHSVRVACCQKICLSRKGKKATKKPHILQIQDINVHGRQTVYIYVLYAIPKSDHVLRIQKIKN
jgi:hypothetical protein